ncbi:MAG: hypothetical protein BWK76_27480 [Desulfobulbaceae bacterium A2]|nr:MAG: hypothetical protein BWK76_27480 [Desulfobulbaceae bacterium A2]
MCELLGMNFNQPVRCTFSFRGFRHRGVNNPHGWGIARYEGNVCQIFKEPLNAARSQLADFLGNYDKFSSKMFIGHVRFATRGNLLLENTHPFSRTFRKREVVLAHNGTVNISQGILGATSLKFRPIGQTDSEYLMCALLTEFSSRRIQFSDFHAIENLLRQVNTTGNMNLIFSEGEHLYCYRDQNGHNGLCWTERCSPFSGKVSLQDEDWEIRLADEKSVDQHGYVIASHPLTNEKWHDVSPGKMLVLKDGQLIY